MTFTAGSLFSGVGMFDLAFALAGFDILFQVEIDDFCQKVLRKHAPTYWPNAQIHADVCRVGRDTLPHVDVLFGGFPCQSISDAGKREGIRAGTQSGLWFEFRRIISELRPPYVLLENVAAITRTEGVAVISDLATMGYDARWGVISAADVGAPHLRERWWCVAINMENTKSPRCTGRGISGGVETPGIIQFVEPANADQMDYSYLKRCEKIHSSAIGDSPVSAWDDAFNGIEARGQADQSRMGGSPDGTAARLDGSRLMAHVFPVGPNMAQPETEAPRMAPGNKHTNNRLKALGNGGLPQIVYPIALEIRALLSSAS